MIVAGYETTANSIHFSLMELAIHPKSQRLVQTEVIAIVETAPPEEWDYESSITSLPSSNIGAVLNEELRLKPPLLWLSRSMFQRLETKRYLLRESNSLFWLEPMLSWLPLLHIEIQITGLLNLINFLIDFTIYMPSDQKVGSSRLLQMMRGRQTA
jgi:hypothetical protein